MGSLLNEKAVKALYELQVALKEAGHNLDSIRIATAEHEQNDFVQVTQAGRVLVEVVP